MVRSDTNFNYAEKRTHKERIKDTQGKHKGLPICRASTIHSYILLLLYKAAIIDGISIIHVYGKLYKKEKKRIRVMGSWQCFNRMHMMVRESHVRYNYKAILKHIITKLSFNI